MHTSIAGLLRDHLVHEFKRQEFLRNVAGIVGTTPTPTPELPTLSSSDPVKRFLSGVDQVLRDAARQ